MEPIVAAAAPLGCGPVTDDDRTYILFYEYVKDILDRRGPHREAHLEHVRAHKYEGNVIMAGALGDPPTGAAIVFRGVGPEGIELFVNDDPYVKAGLVASWRTELWNVVP
jgi:hypothetical protein